MKHLAIAILITLCSCNNDDTTSNWIKQSEHPIKCIPSSVYIDGMREYTLIDNKGNVYATGPVSYRFPEIIN